MFYFVDLFILFGCDVVLYFCLLLICFVLNVGFGHDVAVCCFATVLLCFVSSRLFGLCYVVFSFGAFGCCVRLSSCVCL